MFYYYYYNYITILDLGDRITFMALYNYCSSSTTTYVPYCIIGVTFRYNNSNKQSADSNMPLSIHTRSRHTTNCG